MEMKKFFKVAKSLDHFEGMNDGASASPTISLAEYLCMELEALGLVTHEHIAVIIESFLKLDKDGNGSISMKDAIAAGLIR